MRTTPLALVFSLLLGSVSYASNISESKVSTVTSVCYEIVVDYYTMVNEMTQEKLQEDSSLDPKAKFDEIAEKQIDVLNFNWESNNCSKYAGVDPLAVVNALYFIKTNNFEALLNKDYETKSYTRPESLKLLELPAINPDMLKIQLDPSKYEELINRGEKD